MKPTFHGYFKNFQATIRRAAHQIEKLNKAITKKETGTMNTAPITGKGIWLWKDDFLEDLGLTYEEFAELLAAAGISHVVIKITGGWGEFHTDQELETLRDILAMYGIKLCGYSFLYPDFDPVYQARLGLERAISLNLAVWFIDAEMDWYNRFAEAVLVAQYVNSVTKTIPVALSTFRFPSVHGPFPFAEFMACCSIAAPQVYWQGAHNPGEQLQRSLVEWLPFLKAGNMFFPTGAAYTEHGWQPTPEEVAEFLEVAKDEGFPGANFWRFGHAYVLEDGEIWKTISDFKWEDEEEPPPPPVTCDCEEQIEYLTNRADNLDKQVQMLWDKLGQHTAEFDAMHVIVENLNEDVDKLQVSAHDHEEEPPPPTLPTWFKYTVIDESKTLARYPDPSKGEDGYNDQGKPIMGIFSPRLRWNTGDTLWADNNPITADGGLQYYELQPGQRDANFGNTVPENPPLFVRVRDLQVIE